MLPLQAGGAAGWFDGTGGRCLRGCQAVGRKALASAHCLCLHTGLCSEACSPPAASPGHCPTADTSPPPTFSAARHEGAGLRLQRALWTEVAGRAGLNGRSVLAVEAAAGQEQPRP